MRVSLKKNLTKQQQFHCQVNLFNSFKTTKECLLLWSDERAAFQRPPFTQSKLVRCVKGAVLDVAVDIRTGSPTYGQHVAVEFSEDNHRQFFVPRGFAHGFAVLSETVIFQYKCDNFYAPQANGGISIIDDSLGIDWQIPTEKVLLSDKDKLYKCLAEFDSPFVYDNIELYK